MVTSTYISSLCTILMCTFFSYCSPVHLWIHESTFDHDLDTPRKNYWKEQKCLWTTQHTSAQYISQPQSLLVRILPSSVSPFLPCSSTSADHYLPHSPSSNPLPRFRVIRVPTVIFFDLSSTIQLKYCFYAYCNKIFQTSLSNKYKNDRFARQHKHTCALRSHSVCIGHKVLVNLIPVYHTCLHWSYTTHAHEANTSTDIKIAKVNIFKASGRICPHEQRNKNTGSLLICNGILNYIPELSYNIAALPHLSVIRYHR
jgi:hypothetical protein